MRARCSVPRKGDWKRAKELYGRAFTASKDASYLVEASRTAYQEGEFSESIHFLRVAEAQSPGNPKPLIALLTRYWEIRLYGWQGWTEMRKVHRETWDALDPHAGRTTAQIAQATGVTTQTA